MKKKFLLVLLALVCALCCAFGLAACGGGDGGDANKLKISVTPFEDEGIEQIFFYTADPEVMNDKDEDDDYSYFNYFQNRGNCYDSYDGPSTVKINEGTYAGVVSISIRDSHYVDGSWIYDTMAVKIKVNGTEIQLFPKKLMSDVTIPFSGDYWGLVGDEGVFSEDLTIEVIGNTTIKQFAPSVTLENYEAYKNAETCQGLKFKVGIADSFASFSEMEFEPFEYDSKTEFTAAELKTAMADTNTRFTYFDHVKVTAYFENNTKFFPDYGYARAFSEKARPTKDLSLEWEMNYFIAEDHNITLDFAVFGEAVEVHGQEQLMTLDDMTKINLRHGAAGEMFNSMFESENVKFVVDGIDKTELTLQEYYNADNVKIKSVVSDLGAVILQDQNMYVATISYFGTTNTENEKRLTQSEIIIGNAVDGKKGYKEVTFDLGNYKSFKGASYFTSIELNVYNLVPTVEGYTAMEYYTDALLQSLQKVEFENRTTGGIELEYSGLHEYHWDGLKSDPKNSENQIYYYDKENPDWNDPLAGCYYYGDELALCVGGTDISGLYVTTLELIISRSGESDQTIILTTEGFSDWQLSGTYEGITCEVEDYNTRLVISSGNVTKLSGKLTMELKNNQNS